MTTFQPPAGGFNPERRTLFRRLGATGTATLAGCGGGGSDAGPETHAARALSATASSSADAGVAHGAHLCLFDFLSAAKLDQVAAGSLTDVTQELQAAVRAANGRWLYIPAGKYLLSASIELSDASTAASRPAAKIYGDGIARTVLTNRSGGYALKHSATPAQASARSLAYHGEIAHLSIVADGLSPSGSGGIHLESYWFGWIHDVEIANPRAHGIATPLNAGLHSNSDWYAVGALKLERVEISGARDWGVFNDSPANSLSIDAPYIVNCDIGGIYLAGAASVVRDGAIAGNARGAGGVAGIKLAFSSTTPHNHRLERLEIDNNHVAQVVIEGYHNTVEQCRFIQGATGGALPAAVDIRIDGRSSAGATENTIRDNLLRIDGAPQGAHTFVDIVDAPNSTDNLVTGTQFGGDAPNLVKYQFPPTRDRNRAVERGALVAQSSAHPAGPAAMAVVGCGATMLLRASPLKLGLASRWLDSQGAYDVAQSRFIVPHDGVLSVAVNLLFRPVGSANNPATVYLYRDGVPLHSQHYARGFAAVGVDENAYFSVTFPVSKGQYFELFAKVQVDGTLYLISSAMPMVTYAML